MNSFDVVGLSEYIYKTELGKANVSYQKAISGHHAEVASSLKAITSIPLY